MKNKMKQIMMMLICAVIMLGAVKIPAYAEVNIKPGYYDDQAEGLKRSLAAHPQNADKVQMIIDAGGFSPNIAADMQQAVNQARSGSAKPAQEGTERPQTQAKVECEHTYDAKVTKDSTCEVEGEVTYTCTKCGKTYAEVLPAVNHSYESKITKEATCTEAGEMTYTCTVCDTAYAERIIATGHEAGEPQTVRKATCTGDGTIEFPCSVCGEVLKTESIPATGHTEGDWEVAAKDTLFKAGEEVQKCSICGEVLSSREIPVNMTIWYIICGIFAGTVVAGGIVLYILKRKKVR